MNCVRSYGALTGDVSQPDWLPRPVAVHCAAPVDLTQNVGRNSRRAGVYCFSAAARSHIFGFWSSVPCFWSYSVEVSVPSWCRSLYSSLDLIHCFNCSPALARVRAYARRAGLGAMFWCPMFCHDRVAPKCWRESFKRALPILGCHYLLSPNTLAQIRGARRSGSLQNGVKTLDTPVSTVSCGFLAGAETL